MWDITIPQLKPVLSWKTRIAQLKTLPKGSFVGYGCTFKTTRATRLAVLPVGYADGYDRGLGYQARRLSESGWAELVASQAPPVATWVILDGTTRPLNWCVYGQLADLSCFDPYPINFYGADHAYVRESLSYARQCGAPRRMVFKTINAS